MEYIPLHKSLYETIQALVARSKYKDNLHNLDLYHKPFLPNNFQRKYENLTICIVHVF